MSSDIAILIPTRNRADKLQPLLNNALESTVSDAMVYFIAESDDYATIGELGRLGSSAAGTFVGIIGKFGGYPAAINGGYAQTREPYFLCVNDDVLFTKGWDVVALDKMVDPIRCVGINQGDGRTESFALVDRRYIVERSGVFDKPNTVMHPYLSQYCDDEFADLAKQRGVWADAPGAVIEHQHWTFGKSEVDENYRKAQAAMEPDRVTYEARKALWQKET